MKRSNGITLIYLVITIVILLVLAGISIITLGGDNGLLTRATQTKQAQIEAEMKEELTLAIQDLQIEKLGEATLDDVTQEWIDVKINNYDCTVKDEVSIYGKRVIMEKNGVICKFLIDEKLNIIEIEDDGNGAILEYEVLSRNGDNVNILITITDKENGLQQVEFPDGNIIYCNGNEDVAKDYEVQLGVEYKVIITSKGGQVKEETILINSYYYKITKSLAEGISIDNTAVKTEYNKPYQATITAMEGYEIGDIVVKMGGDLITVDNTTGIINIEKVTGDIEIIVVDKNVIVALGDKNEETGEVTLNLEKYVDQAESGSTIYIPAGTYRLIPMDNGVTSQLGIRDKGKKILFVGENEKTVLVYYGADSKKRDGNLFQVSNANSVVRNMIIEFYPGKSETTYSGCRKCSIHVVKVYSSKCIYTCKRNYSSII